MRRAGISSEGDDAAQRDAAMALLATVLSSQGLEKVNLSGRPMTCSKRPRAGTDRAAAEAVPAVLLAGSSSWGGPPPGGPPPAGPTVEGHPLRAICSATISTSFRSWERLRRKTPWMLQFGGHHLALNITIAGERGVLTPTLTGAQPALYTLQRQDRSAARPGER